MYEFFIFIQFKSCNVNLIKTYMIGFNLVIFEFIYIFRYTNIFFSISKLISCKSLLAPFIWAENAVTNKSSIFAHKKLLQYTKMPLLSLCLYIRTILSEIQWHIAVVLWCKTGDFRPHFDAAIGDNFYSTRATI